MLMGDRKQPAIRFLFDFVSPYAYLAWVQLQKVARAHDALIEPVPVQLTSLLDHHHLRDPCEVPANRRYMICELVRTAHRLEIPFALPPAYPFKSLVAMRMAGLVMSHDERLMLVDALFRGAWEQGRDISNDHDLARVLEDAGLPRTWLRDAELEPARQILRLDTQRAIDAGVFALPTMFYAAEMYVGHSAVADLDCALSGREIDRAELQVAWRNLPAGVFRK